MNRNRTSTVAIFLLAVLCFAPWARAQKQTSPSAIAAARAQMNRGELDAAEKTLWSLLSSNPNQEEALMMLGMIRGRQQRYPEAEALFRRVLQLNSGSLVARQNLARALMAQDKLEAALDQYQEIEKLAPPDKEVRMELARLYLSRGQFSDALTTLRSIPAASFPAVAIPELAAALLGLGRKQEASSLALKARRHPDIAGDLAEVFLNGGSPDDALKTIGLAMPALKHPPARILYVKGRALEAKGQNEEALRSFRQALAADPNSTDPLLATAALYATENKHSESLAMLKRAQSLEPDAPAVLRPVVVEGMKSGEPTLALQAAHKLSQENPDNLDDQYLAAAAMLEAKEFSDVETILQKYVVQRPTEAKAFLGLGIAYLGNSRYAQARTAFEQASKLDPNFAETEYQLALVSEKQGGVPEAIQHLERAVELEPNHALALVNLGSLYLESGALDKAHTMLQRSLAINSDNPRTEYDLALVLSKLGRTQEAKQHLERYRMLQAAEEKAENHGKQPANR